jgi:predicted HAD superfamily Cof-like phosphohydrolase
VTTPNPLQSIADWCEGVGHGPESWKLYFALVLEECHELLDTTVLVEPESGSVDHTNTNIALSLKQLSRQLRNGELQVQMAAKPALDASLDIAWVSLCLARALTGRRLPAAWAELHRSNVTDKQVDGQFIKDASGKVQKPPHWQPPHFAQFVGAAEEGSKSE